MRPQVFFAATALAAVVACSSDSSSAPVTTPGTGGSTSTSGLNISVDSAFADRSAVVATTIPAAVRVTQTGAAAPGVTVTWAVTAGHGSVSTATSVTDATGAATTNWTLGDTAGVNTLQATITGASVTMIGRGTAAAATSIAAASPNPETIVGGASTLVAVRAVDRFGNSVPGVAVSWRVTGGALSSLTTTTGSSGRAEVAFTTPAGAKDYTITASAPGLAAVTITVRTL